MKKGKLSKRTLGLLVATLVLVLLSGGMGVRAALSIFSEDYNAEFKLDDLDVALIENGEVAAQKKPNDEKYEGNLLYYGHEKDGLKKDASGNPGYVEPGRVYKEEIGARNLTSVPEYVRITVRKYWCKPDPTDSKATVKDISLDPELIELYYDDSEYNTAAWKINEAETTTERKVYYLTSALGEGDSPLLFNKFRVSDKIVGDINDEDFVKTETKDEDGHTIYTYTYNYDGRRACIEADVQSIQTHNGADAVDSIWGVDNVTASNGTITVTD